MAQQRHLSVAFVEQVVRFGHNAFGVSTPFSTAGKRHHAKTAHVVATAHDGDESGYAFVVKTDRFNLCISLLSTQQRVDRFLPPFDFSHKSGKVSVGIRANHQINQLLFLQKLLLEPFGHATQNAHLELRFALLLSLQALQAMADPLFGIVANRTRIEQNQVGFRLILRGGVTRIGQDAGHDFAVTEVHLTAITLKVELLGATRTGFQGFALAGFINGMVARSHGLIFSGRTKLGPNLTTCQFTHLFCIRPYGRSTRPHKSRTTL